MKYFWSNVSTITFAGEHVVEVFSGEIKSLASLDKPSALKLNSIRWGPGMNTMIRILLLAFITLSASGASDELHELGQRMMTFHTGPTKEKFDRIQELMKKHLSELEQRDSGTKALRTAVFLARIKLKYGWNLADIGHFDDLAQEVIAGKSELARYANDDHAVDPTKLDIWWWEYFATGDDKYLAQLLKQTGDLDDLMATKGDLDSFRHRVVLMSVANWSVKSNCSNAPSVLRFVKKAIDQEKDAGRHRFLEECIQSADLNESPTNR